MLQIGVPAGLQGMVFSLSNITIQSSINSLGAAVMAGSSASFNVEILPYYVMNAFGQACTTFTGQNVGAGQRERCRRILRQSLLLAVGFSYAICALIILARYPILSLFNTEEAVLAYGSARLLFILTTYPVYVILEVFSGCLRGFARSLAPALITVFGICGTRILWVLYVFPKNPTFPMLLAVYPISWVISAVIILLYYARVRKKLYTA